MKVFISWSGEPSRSVALALRDWLGTVLQQVEPWMSDVEIDSGARWDDTIARAVNETDFGIICVTRANQSAPWLLFESGALAKRLDTGARVVPLCVDLAPGEITGPLGSFQARRLDRDGVARLVHDVNAHLKPPIPETSVRALFDAMWPSLRAAIATALEAEPASDPAPRSTEDMLTELIELTRRIERQAAASSFGAYETVMPALAAGVEPSAWTRLLRERDTRVPYVVWLRSSTDMPSSGPEPEPENPPD